MDAMFRFVVNNIGSPGPINIAEIEVYANNNGLQDQRITFDPIDRVASTAAPFDLSASSDSGLPVMFSICFRARLLLMDQL